MRPVTQTDLHRINFKVQPINDIILTNQLLTLVIGNLSFWQLLLRHNKLLWFNLSQNLRPMLRKSSSKQRIQIRCVLIRNNKYMSLIKYVLLVCCSLLIQKSIAQSQSTKKSLLHLNLLLEKDKPRADVLLLGTFHFAGEKVDENISPNDLAVDMLSAERQRQIKQLAKKLSKFKPTKIAIEVSPGRERYYDSLYTEYVSGKTLTGKRLDPADETFQLGFRIAKLLGHKKLYPIDAQPFRFRLSTQDSVLTYQKFSTQIDTAYTYWNKKYDAEQRFQDTLKFRLPLNEYLQYLNATEKRASSIGRWLISTKKGDNSSPVGADGFITRYFNRNVRIYSNVQRITSGKREKILIIYGATHMYLLDQIFKASPEYKVSNIMKYLK